MDIKQFKKLPILGILRGIKADSLVPLIEAIFESGLKTIELTMNTDGACGLIKKAVKLSKGKLNIGAGTVLDMDSLKQALDAGATFIVSPVLVKDVVRYCAKNKIPVFPGALTPQEIFDAWREGADMVKVFPIKFFGPQYLKEIKGPFAEIELLACAGITPGNLAEYFSCGASAVAFGANVFSRGRLERGDYSGIAASIKAYLESFNRYSALKRRP